MRVAEALRSGGVVSDFRPPNVIRLAPIPLYNTYHEVWKIVQHLKEIVDKRVYEAFPKERKKIS
jgi:kynureninase